MNAGLHTSDEEVASPWAEMSLSKRLLLLLGGYIPLCHVIGMGTTTGLLWHRPWVCAGTVLLVLYLLPPMIVRGVMILFPVRKDEIEIGSRDFFVWWFSLNMQMLFCRFAVLEECLRVIPGCYSMWLRLWGAKVGRLTYWAAGVTIIDRQCLTVGDNVTFGASVRIIPHVIAPNDQGQVMLLWAPVVIGDRVSVGGNSLLSAGAEIAPDQHTRAFLILPPFGRLEKGKRVKSDRIQNAVSP